MERRKCKQHETAAYVCYVCSAKAVENSGKERMSSSWTTPQSKAADDGKHYTLESVHIEFKSQNTICPTNSLSANSLQKLYTDKKDTATKTL
jgi:hypothetical protein